jgi:hypothetical protein
MTSILQTAQSDSLTSFAASGFQYRVESQNDPSGVSVALPAGTGEQLGAS